MRTSRHVIPALVVSLLCLAAAAPAAAQTEAEDPFLWLEEIEGDRAMEWVLARNAETRAELQARPSYRRTFDEVLEILTSDDRIAYPSIRGDRLYNFWRDAEHPRGVYRRTSWAAYLSGDPDWETVLDVDALAEAEGTPWAYGGMTCLFPEERHCLVSLSPGGSDATEVREFDLETGRFVEGGFHIPVSKNTVAWVDRNTVLVGHNLDPGYVTTSGYARAVRRWERGAPLEAAEVLAECTEEQMGMWVATAETAARSIPMVLRFVTIFDTEYHFLQDGRLVRLDVPSDAHTTLVGDQMVLQLYSDWEVGGRVYPAGAVVSANLDAYLGGERAVDVVITPDARSTVDGTIGTRDYLLVNLLTDVQGRLLRYRRESGAWKWDEIDMPPMGAVGVTAASTHDNRFFFTFSSFTQPTTLYLAEEDGSIRAVRSLPHQFDAEGLTAEQYHATSRDGTRVPYFVVRPEDAPMDGSNPTLLTAYGGFQISRTPSYLGTYGKGWVEGGGVYVLANIRGGGEFGPSWWKAALKENRQRAYDDFLAVAQDLVARRITSPEHLGIMGGSNGGLLVGAAMTQRPDLFGAVVIQVPLLDMKRYHKLLAGASWIAEYGNPDIAEEWAFIREYSPYQNVEADVDYPRPFIFTTTRDDRVHPGHARKMAALMRSLGHDVLYFENVEGGHGSGVTPEQQAESLALTLTYLDVQLGPRRRPVGGSAQEAPWPRRVVITNDDGFESPATLELARAFAEFAETFLIVPAQDRSSSSNFAVAARTLQFDVERRDVGAGITAWAVDGYPGDCIYFALAGPLRDEPPDLVITGINTGSNVADAWVASGTVGAARMASYYGVPALALSGVDNDDPEAVAAVVRWAVKLARSDIVRRLEPPQYLTVSFPVGPASSITGVEVAEHARGLRTFEAELLPSAGDAPGKERWSFQVVRDAFPTPPGTDAALVAQGKITIVPMRVDESDPDMSAWLRRNKARIPPW